MPAWHTVPHRHTSSYKTLLYSGHGYEAGRLPPSGSRRQRRGIHPEDDTTTEPVLRPDLAPDDVPSGRGCTPADLRRHQQRRRRPQEISRRACIIIIIIIIRLIQTTVHILITKEHANILKNKNTHRQKIKLTYSNVSKPLNYLIS